MSSNKEQAITILKGLRNFSMVSSSKLDEAIDLLKADDDPETTNKLGWFDEQLDNIAKHATNRTLQMYGLNIVEAKGKLYISGGLSKAAKEHIPKLDHDWCKDCAKAYIPPVQSVEKLKVSDSPPLESARLKKVREGWLDKRARQSVAYMDIVEVIDALLESKVNQ